MANSTSRRKNGSHAAEQILREISIAAHEYSKEQTTVLTSLLNRPKEQEHKFDDREEWAPMPKGAPRVLYKSRLFTRPAERLAYSSPFEKDIARVVHSPAFRKLQGKSQLIPAGENYFFRTRLTHSIEVAEIAARIALKLNHDNALHGYRLDNDLISCAALLHDIGHPPFGHSGEDVLNRKMLEYGGFEGNAQTLRLVTRLENRLGRGGSVQGVYRNPRGLNLTLGTLGAVLKYDRKYDGPTFNSRGELVVTKGYYQEEEELVSQLKTRLGVAPTVKLHTIECQVMDIADDIAYSAYDLEDTMEAGIVTPFDFISVDDATLDSITTYVNAQLAKRAHTSTNQKEVITELARIFETILQDADTAHPYNMTNSVERTVFVGRSHNEQVLHARNHLIRRQFLETLIEENVAGLTVRVNRRQPFMSELQVDRSRLLRIECMKAFNFYKVISSRKLQIPHHRSAHIVAFLFDALAADTEGKLLSDFERMMLRQCAADKQRRMRLICDIIASRTDAEAIRLFNRLNGFANGSVFDYA